MLPTINNFTHPSLDPSLTDVNLADVNLTNVNLTDVNLTEVNLTDVSSYGELDYCAI